LLRILAVSRALRLRLAAVEREPRDGASTRSSAFETVGLDENFMAERMNEGAAHVVACTYAARQISWRVIAESGDNAAHRKALRLRSGIPLRTQGRLRLAAQGFERILVPSMLGLHCSETLIANSSTSSVAHWARCYSAPSIPGLRLSHRLWRYLHRMGVELFQGFRCRSWRFTKGHAQGCMLQSGSPFDSARRECGVGRGPALC